MGRSLSFLPQVDEHGAGKELRCRAAVASTFLGGLELAREGRLVLEQDQPWLDIELRPVC